ncbi:Hpt domain-containing protein [Pararhizobium haloflavum]|uniref:Hpt domain-containing protein n=1 Tax=Pararhizobium haloflavum TaxID=2037914 RepID=UPI000C1848EC|nr:Hpt domain-containing protein [Pararhizobium haloflavum]
MQALPIAFNRPECRQRVADCRRPIDLEHFSRQTMGNKELEAEVLQLFIRQVRECTRAIERSGSDRAGLAHMLKGSARGVGAFTLADRAAALESEPESEAHVEALARAVVEVENFLLRLSR